MEGGGAFVCVLPCEEKRHQRAHREVAAAATWPRALHLEKTCQLRDTPTLFNHTTHKPLNK